MAAPPVGHGAVRRAMVGIVKRQLSAPRPKHFVNRCIAGLYMRAYVAGCFVVTTFVTNMVLAVQRGLEDQTFAMLWLISYTFLLRLPSEVGLCSRSPGIDLCLCVRRRYQLARRTLTFQAPLRSNHCYGERANTFVFACSEGRTVKRAAACSSESARAKVGLPCVPYTCYGNSTLPSFLMGHGRGKTFQLERHVTDSGRFCLS